MQLRLEVRGSLSDTTNLRSSVDGLKKQPTFDGYSKIILTVSDEVEYTAGTDSGRTLTLSCPWGTQEMADRILSKVRGFQYQPFSASGAHLDPASEIGDGVTVGRVYSGIFSKKISHGPLYTADISAPGGENINYEYKYKSPTERSIERNYKETKASLRIQAGMIEAEAEERKGDVETINGRLTVQAGEISAKVSKTGGEIESFAWDMQTDHWSAIANNSEVFRIDKTGATVTGIIRATGGEIGGFKIMSDYLSYNDQTWGGTNTVGAYLGTSGFQMGKNFKVDMSGNLKAASGEFEGAVNAGSIRYGDNYGTFDGGGITGGSIYGNRLAANTVSTAYTSAGINKSLGYADFANGAFSGYNWVGNMFTGKLKVSGTVEMLGYSIGLKSKTVATPSGGSTTIYYLGYA